MEIEFKQKVHLINGQYASKKNIGRIKAVSSKPCTNVHGNPIIDRIKAADGSYFEEWRIHKEKEGYIFWEVSHKMGISGHHKTVKACVLSACRFSHIKVIIEK